MNPARALSFLLVPTALGGLFGARHALREVAAMPIATPAQAPAAVQPPPAPAAAPTVALASEAEGPVRLSARLDRGAVQQGGDGLVHLELSILGVRPEGAQARLPTDLVVVLDHSGSMAGDKLAQARDAVGALIDELAPEDRFGLVTYDSEADLRIPMGLATPWSKLAWKGLTSAVMPGGGTNMSEGLDLGIRAVAESVPGRARRVVLISDGLPNEGDASTEGLLGRARSAAVSAVPMTAVGVGLDFNEDLMRAMADAGTGNYYFLEQGAALAEVFSQELNAASATVASGLEVHLRAAPGTTLVSAAGYPITYGDVDASFRVGDLAGGQERKLWLTLKVDPEVVGTQPIGALSVRYQDGDSARGAALTGALAVAVVPDQAAALASIDQGAWEEAVLTEEYSALRTRVASSVKSGNQAEAEAAIRDYRLRNAQLNRAVGSAAVDGNLNELKYLEDSVSGSFQGDGQAQKQNVFSKTVSSEAYRARRKGQMSSSAR